MPTASIEPLLFDIGSVGVESAAPTATHGAPSPPPRATQAPPEQLNDAAADAAAVAAADAAAEQQIETLKAMFPDLDKEIIEAILAETGSVERAVQGLLDVSSPTSADAPGETAAEAVPAQSVPSSSSVDADAQLALALFQEFADSLDSRVPEEVRRNPDQYEQFVRQSFEREMARKDSPLFSGGDNASATTDLFSKMKISGASFLDRFKLGRRGPTFARMSEYTSPLVAAPDEEAVTSGTRSSAAYAPPQPVVSPLTTLN